MYSRALGIGVSHGGMENEGHGRGVVSTPHCGPYPGVGWEQDMSLPEEDDEEEKRNAERIHDHASDDKPLPPSVVVVIAAKRVVCTHVHAAVVQLVAGEGCEDA